MGGSSVVIGLDASFMFHLALGRVRALFGLGARQRVARWGDGLAERIEDGPRIAFWRLLLCG
jgi:hypothetical protein